MYVCVCSSLASSPSIETESDTDSTFHLNRRSSSGGLLSPEVVLLIYLLF